MSSPSNTITVNQKLEWSPNKKQEKAWVILNDKTTTELFYGGGAGGGKSYLGCIWLITMCLKYPGSRWLMGRAILKTLKTSTLLTFFGICREWGFKADVDYEYRSQPGTIKWSNGSEIYLKDLFAYPSDPEFDNLGSTEYTGAFVDEASQITNKAKEILMSRIRYKLDEFGLIPKLLIASNPSKNFLYYEFYKPFKDGTLVIYRRFIKALATDNPNTSKHYIENLKKLSKNSRERLLYGNFEYDDDPAKLFEIDDIMDLFTNKLEVSEDKYLTCDIARKGADNIEIMYWEGLDAKRIWEFSKQDTKKTEEQIIAISDKYKVKRSHITIDEDGVGGGVVDHIPNVKGFVNNATPIITDESKENQTVNYRNLKSQCWFYLAEEVRKGKVAISAEISPEMREKIIEDLEQIKQKDADKDGKLQVIGKDKIKENIGRSTDIGDALMMRMLFELKEKVTGGVGFI